ncbi:MAG: riboflavin biosynthesis protein RibF [Lachnospiraceae bacterium]|nr:riboflavin biosynthesis protein RibF [Lachnospiraceae bacterium]
MICIENKDFVLDEHTVVTLGKFDGIHKGHRKLIQKALEISNKTGMKTAVFTFRVTEENKFPYMESEKITTPDERKSILEELGVDILVEYPFDTEVADTEPVDFLADVLKNKMKAAYVVVGEDWTFGRGGRGNAQTLKENGEKLGFEPVILEKETYDGRKIGSSWVREEITAGHMETVNILLDYPYSITGVVVHGNRIGRTIGFPTANIVPDKDKILPPFGVYASKTVIDGKEEYYGISNIGVKPTISDNNAVNVETNLIGYDGNLYGSSIKVELIHFQRPEMKFESVEALKNQLVRDIEFSKTYFMI